MLSILNLDSNLEKVINSILFEINLTSNTHARFSKTILTGVRVISRYERDFPSPHPVCQLFIRVSDVKLFMDVAFPKILVKIK